MLQVQITERSSSLIFEELLSLETKKYLRGGRGPCHRPYSF